MNYIRSLSALSLYLLSGGLLCAAQNPEVTGVALKVENDLTDCMEKRRLTFTANTSVTWHDGGPYRIHYKLNLKGPTGGYSQVDEDWTMEQQCVFDPYTVPLVPRTGAKDYALQAYATAVDEGGYYSEMTSNTMSIDARRLWIEEFKDAGTGKDWKVCVGRPITYKGYASTDVGAHSWYWAMKDQNSEVWEVTTVNTKSGSDMSIPYWNLGAVSPTKHNSDFGDVHGTVYTLCEDAEGNTHKLYSTEMEGNSKKAKVYFDAFLNINGEQPTTSRPPCWYVFWKDGSVVDGMDTYGYVQRDGLYGVTTSSSKKFGPQAAKDSGSPWTLHLLNGSTKQAGAPNYLYLKCVAITILHENYHYSLLSRYGENTDGQGDTDQIPDAEEVNPTDRAYFPPSLPNNANTFGLPIYDGGGYEDNEARARQVETGDTMPNIHPDRDWAAYYLNPQW
jgi:hypothetical protein